MAYLIPNGKTGVEHSAQDTEVCWSLCYIVTPNQVATHCNRKFIKKGLKTHDCDADIADGKMILITNESCWQALHTTGSWVMKTLALCPVIILSVTDDRAVNNLSYSKMYTETPAKKYTKWIASLPFFSRAAGAVWTIYGHCCIVILKWRQWAAFSLPWGKSVF